MSETRFRSGMLVFPNLTQLDLTGPYEVLARLPGAETLLLWKTLDPVRSEHGLTILPMATLSSCPPLDLVLVPGGAGINPLLEDPEVLGFLRRAAAEARYVVGVCTGSLVLGAARLLRGRRAATHWMSRDLLRPLRNRARRQGRAPAFLRRPEQRRAGHRRSRGSRAQRLRHNPTPPVASQHARKREPPAGQNS